MAQLTQSTHVSESLEQPVRRARPLRLSAANAVRLLIVLCAGFWGLIVFSISAFI